MSVDISAHNARQREYFEAAVKPTMVPSDTPYLRRHVEEALRYAGLLPRERVLEVGCGMGRYTLLLARRVNVEGLDLSPVLLERLRGFGGDGIPLHCGDIAEPPEALTGRFDAVLGFFMLHHVHDLVSCLRGAARVLRPGGRLVFLEPNAYNPLFYVQVTLSPGMSWKGDRGLVDMRPSVLTPALQAAGLRPMPLSRFGFVPPFIANRSWGARLEARLERVRLWRGLLPFQLVGAYRD